MISVYIKVGLNNIHNSNGNVINNDNMNRNKYYTITIMVIIIFDIYN